MAATSGNAREPILCFPIKQKIEKAILKQEERFPNEYTYKAFLPYI